MRAKMIAEVTAEQKSRSLQNVAAFYLGRCPYVWSETDKGIPNRLIVAKLNREDAAVPVKMGKTGYNSKNTGKSKGKAKDVDCAELCVDAVTYVEVLRLETSKVLRFKLELEFVSLCEEVSLHLREASENQASTVTLSDAAAIPTTIRIAAASLFGRWRAVTQTALQRPTIPRSPVTRVNFGMNTPAADVKPVVVSKQAEEVINGVVTQVVCTAFTDHILVVVTQYGKMGTLVSVTPNMVSGDLGKPTLTTKVLLGCDEPVIHVCAKNLVSFVSQAKNNLTYIYNYTSRCS
ncbi:unnamed protein product [Ranitomeya imitator]|uniref:Proteasome assembly chaperone 3 n=1 Tax=Ranitomeya imitator TaxID=111125 RepID=A0ABN9MHB5_9NEOB|nr:unnamed protein product [Ranitomeya imitator]